MHINDFVCNVYYSYVTNSIITLNDKQKKHYLLGGAFLFDLGKFARKGGDCMAAAPYSPLFGRVFLRISAAFPPLVPFVEYLRIVRFAGD